MSTDAIIQSVREPSHAPSPATADTDTARAVLSTAARGFRLFPVEPRGKPPLIADWPNQASSDPERIRFWLRRWPQSNWGLATGPGSGVFVLDVDGEAGLESLQKLIRIHGYDWTKTLAVKTSRGRHLYFFCPEDARIRNSAGKLGPGLDIRGDGGYVIIPPSVHPDGQPYWWSNDTSDTAFVAAPDWLMEMLTEPVRVPGFRTITGCDFPIGVGHRNSVLTSLAGSMRYRGMSSRAIEEALLAENDARCKPPLPTEEVREIAKSVSRYQPGNGARRDPEHDGAVPTPQWPSPLEPAAISGLPGEFVSLVSPETEADPAAILFSFLVATGSIIGRGPYCAIGADRHYTNLYTVILAQSSKGRKGMSFGEVRRVASQVDQDWGAQCCASGMSSGEGLIWAVRDEIVEYRGDKEEKVVDPGVADKRLLIQEGELSQALQAIARDGNTLSPVIRLAWDGGPLRVLTKNAKAACLEPHISIIGHITVTELQRLLTTNDTANGFANRFLWVCARRSNCLPFGGVVDEQAIAALAAKIRDVVDFAREVRRVTFASGARDEWASIYPALSDGRPGLLGAVTARAEAQTLRLAMIYALLDRSPSIRLEHLRGALAAWKYCEHSARFIFGDKLGDPTADEILQLLRGAADGITRNTIMDHFKRNKSSAEIGRALAVLQSFGLARSCSLDTGGRKAELWLATGQIAEYEIDELNEKRNILY